LAVLLQRPNDGALMAKKPTKLFRVAYDYRSDAAGARLQKFSIIVAAHDPEGARAAVEARMRADGMPMCNIVITGSTTVAASVEDTILA